MTIHFPDTYYVGIKPNIQSNHDVPLAYLVPDGTDLAAVKRKASADSWAEQIVYDQKTGKHISTSGSSKTVDNIPIEGFKIVNSIKRSRDWFGSGRTVWRIEDPRGFEFEITSGNLDEIINLTTIENGLIKGKCLYAREGAKNALITENSEEYAKISEQTNLLKKASTIKLGDITPGSKCIMIDNTEQTYYGKFYCLVEDVEYIKNKNQYWPGPAGYNTRKLYYDLKEKYIMVDSNEIIHYASKPKIAGTLTQGNLSAEEATRKINSLILTQPKSYIHDVRYVNKKKFDLANVKLQQVYKPIEDLFKIHYNSDNSIHWIEQIYQGYVTTVYNNQTVSLHMSRIGLHNTNAANKQAIYYVFEPHAVLLSINFHEGLIKIDIQDNSIITTYGKSIEIPNPWAQIKGSDTIDQDSIASNLKQFILNNTWQVIEADLNGERFPAFKSA